jgi:hypothetical protein
MTLKKIGSREFVVNLLSDFILTKLPKNESSQIVVVDCENFFVIKGKTSSKEVLNVSDLVSEFTEEFKFHLSESKISHTIDLIQYDSKIDEITEIKQTLHNNTPNCSYHYLDVDNFPNLIEKKQLVYVSQFPHGYSLNQGRLLYYYAKHILYNIPSDYPVTSLTFTISNKKNEDGEIEIDIYDEFFKSNDERLKSAVLDVFDFNFSKLKNEIEKIDITSELTDPLSEHEILKRKVENFYII